jgi:hypothetical protein
VRGCFKYAIQLSRTPIKPVIMLLNFDLIHKKWNFQFNRFFELISKKINVMIFVKNSCKIIPSIQSRCTKIIGTCSTYEKLFYYIVRLRFLKRWVEKKGSNKYCKDIKDLKSTNGFKYIQNPKDFDSIIEYCIGDNITFTQFKNFLKEYEKYIDAILNEIHKPKVWMFTIRQNIQLALTIYTPSHFLSNFLNKVIKKYSNKPYIIDIISIVTVMEHRINSNNINSSIIHIEAAIMNIRKIIHGK